MGEQATVVLVHGAWHGAWCWDRVAECLHSAGVANVVVENPSVLHAGTTVTDDADNVRSALDAIAGPVVLVGHSYGGAVVTDAGMHDAVRHVLYLTAFALDDGESVMANDLAGGEDAKLVEALAFEEQTVSVERARAVEFFYHDCDAETGAWATANLRPMSLAAMSAAPREIAWRHKPATYVVCTDDRALPIELQRSSARRTGAWVELPTSHSPFLSRPDLVAGLLVDFSRS